MMSRKTMYIHFSIVRANDIRDLLNVHEEKLRFVGPNGTITKAYEGNLVDFATDKTENQESHASHV